MSTKLQVLCATMHQKDFAKLDEMKIASNVVYANQADGVWYRKIKKDEYFAEMITTQTRGASNNRNILLTYATADICLLADDDVVYYEGYAKKVIDAFGRHKDADMIIFNMDTDSKERTIEKIKKEEKMRLWDRNPYGSVRVAFKLSSQKKYNIWFNTLLGPGAMFSSGEDSMFVEDFLRKGNVYLSTDVLGEVRFDTSTWFNGYNKKYFTDQGGKIAAIGYRFPYLRFLYYGVRVKTKELGLWKKIECMIKGYYKYKRMGAG